VVVFSAATMAEEETEGGVEEGVELVGEVGEEGECLRHCHHWPNVCLTEHRRSAR